MLMSFGTKLTGSSVNVSAAGSATATLTEFVCGSAAGGMNKQQSTAKTGMGARIIIESKVTYFSGFRAAGVVRPASINRFASGNESRAFKTWVSPWTATL